MLRRRRQGDFADEIRAHIALETERLRREGLSPADAESAARRAFGNATTTEEQFFESTRVLWWDEAWRDLAYALHALRQNPVFTAAAVLTLALGIGANTAIFSFIDMALLRPLPYPEPRRIAALYGSGDSRSLSPATFLDFRRQASSFEHLAAFRETPFNLSGYERPEQIEGATVTPDFFAVFGVPALIGRSLTAEQDPPGATRTVVLSYSLWQRRFAGSPDVLGKPVQIDGEPLIVVGVMPPYFQYPPGCDAWRPARHQVPEQPLRPLVDQSNARDAHYFNTIGRLNPGVTPAKAQTESDTIARRLKQQYGDAEEIAGTAVISLQDDLIGETKSALLVLLGAVSLLLLIACANVANILLARGATRQKEIAIRTALGAGRARLVRQLLTESLTLGVAGGGLGILLAYCGLAPLGALLPPNATGGGAVQLDARVLAFTAILSVSSATVFGLFPTLQTVSVDLNGVLKEGGRGSASGSRAGRARSILVVSEVALAGVLLIGAGLLLRSFSRLLAVPEGFAPEHVLSLQLSLPNARYPTPAGRARFVRQVLSQMAAAPGGSSAAAISRLPLNPGNSTRGLDIKGRVEPPGGDLGPDYLVVSPDYFRAMGIRIARGRPFTERDDAGGMPVVMVNQAMARHFWPGQDPLGQSVMVGACGNENQWCEVVGVVDDVRQHGLDQAARPAVYVPYYRDPWPFMVFVVRTGVDPASMATAMEIAVHSVDREQPVYNIRTMRDIVAGSLSPRRLRMQLIGSFALLALVLACVGIYGVMAYAVVQRMQEIGIRIALGANRTDVLRIVVAQALRLSLAGVVVGAILALGLTRFLAKMLYGVQPTDAVTFGGVAVLLVFTALVASAIPALRATHVDPLASLRVQ